MLFSRPDGLKTVSYGQLGFPVFSRNGSLPGPILTITAGMDGDEYDGIEAACRFIDEIKTTVFRGSINIVPISNPAGFWAETSKNPIDGKFPKLIFPGNPNGSDSEKLIATIRSSFIPDGSIWFDLHGGSLTEELSPYIWAARNGIAEVDGRKKTYFESLSGDTVVYERSTFKSDTAEHGITYIMSEAGDGRGRSEETIHLHLARIRALMSSLHMTDDPISSDSPCQIYTKTAFAFAPFAGMWFPAKRIIRSIDRTRTETIKIPDGHILYTHTGMAVRERDILVAIAYEKTDRIP